MASPLASTRRAILLAALAVLFGPGQGGAQLATKPVRVGFRGSAAAVTFTAGVRAFRESLHGLGWVEGQNVLFEERYADERYDRLPVLAADLVAQRVAVLFAMGTPAVQAAKSATTTIPIVMETHGDAVSTGLVSNLARPGGNVTGVSGFAPELNAKRLELIRELLPAAQRVGVIANRSNPATAIVVRVTEATAQQLRLQLQLVDVRTPAELERAFETLTRPRCDALLVVTDLMLASVRARIVDLAARHRLPAVYDGGAWTQTAGLLSYGPLPTERFERAAVYVDRILKGARPGDLPIEQPSTFELVLNVGTARRLGIDFPPALRLRAARVIE
jgi:putative ABC transport system substrate-binding protein